MTNILLPSLSVAMLCKKKVLKKQLKRNLPAGHSLKMSEQVLNVMSNKVKPSLIAQVVKIVWTLVNAIRSN